MGVPPNPNVLEEGTADAPLVRLYNFMREFNIPRTMCIRKLTVGCVRRDHVPIISTRDIALPGTTTTVPGVAAVYVL